MLKNETLTVIFGVDTAENEPDRADCSTDGSSRLSSRVLLRNPAVKFPSIHGQSPRQLRPPAAFLRGRHADPAEKEKTAHDALVKRKKAGSQRTQSGTG